MRHLLAILLLVVTGVSARAQEAEPVEDSLPMAPRSTFTSAAERIKAWHDDLSQLRRELPKLHVNLFADCARDDWVKAAAELDRQLGELSDSQIRVEMSRLVAKLGDGHTSIRFPPSEADRYLPFFVEQFADGWYITSATAEHKDLLECRLVEIEGHAIAEVVERLGEITSSDNPFGRDLGATWHLTNVDMLAGLGLVQEAEEIEVRVRPLKGGDERRVKLPTAKVKRETLLTAPDSTPGKDEALPISLRQRSRPYGHRMIGFGALYLWYDACRDQREGQTVAQWTARVLKEIDRNPPERVIIDLRRNGGGLSNLLDPMIRSLAEVRKAGKVPGGIYVLIGSNTQSAAQRNTSSLKFTCKATLVGTPTGQGPRRFGAIRTFALDNSRARVSYSTRRWGTKLPPLPAGEIDAVNPDVPVARDAGLHFAGRDPALEAALMHGP